MIQLNSMLIAYGELRKLMKEEQKESRKSSKYEATAADTSEINVTWLIDFLKLMKVTAPVLNYIEVKLVATRSE